MQAGYDDASVVVDDVSNRCCVCRRGMRLFFFLVWQVVAVVACGRVVKGVQKIVLENVDVLQRQNKMMRICVSHFLVQD